MGGALVMSAPGAWSKATQAELGHHATNLGAANSTVQEVRRRAVPACPRCEAKAGWNRESVAVSFGEEAQSH